MAYPDSILHEVTKPARYTGGEWNSLAKDWDKAEVRTALVFPELYEIGMSNLAVSILYQILNNESKVLCERAFAPWIDMESKMRAAGIPILSLESQHPLSEFDIIGFSLSYELTYTNVLNMLQLAGIPVLASQRDISHPLIIAGGSCALNPEPMVDFIDLFVIGEGEEVVLQLIDIFQSWKHNGGDRTELLLQAATIPGVYVPTLYHVDYYPDGTVAGINPLASQASPVVRRRMVEKLPPPNTKPIVPYLETVHDRAALEIQRGCTRGCRFCQAGMIYRPRRQRPQDEVVTAVGELLKNCGYSEVSLLSLSSSDYPGIDKLVDTLRRNYGDSYFTISLPSLRIDNFSTELADSLQSQKKTSITFAPEAGSERLRRVINKGLPEKEILGTIATAMRKGWSNFKLYFVIGLPTETADDIESIVDLVGKIHRLGKVTGLNPPRLKLNISTFVPKAHTPFQWVGQDSQEQLRSKLERLSLGLRRRGIRLSWQDPQVSLLEAVLARGDRRLGNVIYRAWQLGCTFDAWSEHFNYDRWLSAFEQCGLDPSFYAHRERPLTELFPWNHIDVGVSQEFLKREYQRAQNEQETPDCHQGECNRCGLERWQHSCQARLKWTGENETSTAQKTSEVSLGAT